jgi:hypothetical protein
MAWTKNTVEPEIMEGSTNLRLKDLAFQVMYH